MPLMTRIPKPPSLELKSHDLELRIQKVVAYLLTFLCIVPEVIFQIKPFSDKVNQCLKSHMAHTVDGICSVPPVSFLSCSVTG